MRCISVMLVCLMDTSLHSIRWYACLAFFVPRLAFFTSLHLCTFTYMFMHASLCVLVSSSLIPTNLVRVHTHPQYTRPRVPFRNFVWWHVCRPYSNLMELWTLDPNPHFSSLDTPFCLTTCFFAPVWLSLIVCPLACFLSSYFFACLLACFLWFLHVHAWSKETWSEDVTS